MFVYYNKNQVYSLPNFSVGGTFSLDTRFFYTATLLLCCCDSSLKITNRPVRHAVPRMWILVPGDWLNGRALRDGVRFSTWRGENLDQDGGLFSIASRYKLKFGLL